RGPRDESARLVDFRVRLDGGRVLLLTHGLESILAGNELDLVEVQPAVDRDHEPEVLERERDELRRRNLEDVAELTDRDELIDADGLALPLDLGRALRLYLLPRNAVVERAPAGSASLPGPECAHGPRDIGRDGFLIHRPALPFLASAAAHRRAAARVPRRPLFLAARGCCPSSWRRRGDRTRWDERGPAGDRARAGGARHDGPRTRPVID